ncbi:MAG: hypothetical protein K9W44_16335 [Candidatus Lokiarchaeota archaeon]|nr:hypothetical protein [Candidatus Harpocratesius repetitus]
MVNNRDFFLNGKWECAEGMFELMVEGGSFEIGFYHKKCNFSNYKGLRIGVSPPDLGADTSDESGSIVELDAICENCKEEFLFIAENKIHGCEIYEADGKIPEKDIFYKNKQQFNSLDNEDIE